MRILAGVWPKSLLGRLILFATGLFATAFAIAWWAVGATVRAPAEEAVDNQLRALGRELRGYWATAEITGNVPQGPANLDWMWQITVEQGPIYRSEMLRRENVDLPAVNDKSESNSLFSFSWLETELGQLWVAQRQLTETRPAPPDVGQSDREWVNVTYSVALTSERREALIIAHTAPLKKAAAVILAVFAAVLFTILLILGLIARAPLKGLERAAQRYRAGETASIEGPYPAETDSVVTSLNEMIGQNDRLVERTRRYINKIAHDLKHPLAVLRNALDQPADRPIAEKRIAAMAETIDRYANLASAIGPGGAKNLSTCTRFWPMRATDLPCFIGRHR